MNKEKIEDIKKVVEEEELRMQALLKNRELLTRDKLSKKLKLKEVYIVKIKPLDSIKKNKNSSGIVIFEGLLVKDKDIVPGTEAEFTYKYKPELKDEYVSEMKLTKKAPKDKKTQTDFKFVNINKDKYTMWLEPEQFENLMFNINEIMHEEIEPKHTKTEDPNFQFMYGDIQISGTIKEEHFEKPKKSSLNKLKKFLMKR